MGREKRENVGKGHPQIRKELKEIKNKRGKKREKDKILPKRKFPEKGWKKKKGHSPSKEGTFPWGKPQNLKKENKKGLTTG